MLRSDAASSPAAPDSRNEGSPAADRAASADRSRSTEKLICRRADGRASARRVDAERTFSPAAENFKDAHGWKTLLCIERHLNAAGLPAAIVTADRNGNLLKCNARQRQNSRCRGTPLGQWKRRFTIKVAKERVSSVRPSVRLGRRRASLPPSLPLGCHTYVVHTQLYSFVGTAHLSLLKRTDRPTDYSSSRICMH